MVKVLTADRKCKDFGDELFLHLAGRRATRWAATLERRAQLDVALHDYNGGGVTLCGGRDLSS